MSKVVIALGGNALQKPGEEATSENQIKNILLTAKHIAEIVKAGNEVVITHGNGPQVGRIMLQNEIAKHSTPNMPMDVCGAMTQGMIGYQIQQCLQKLFSEMAIDKEVATVVTQVEVDKNDSAFRNPTKPVGPFYTKEEAEELEKTKKQTFKMDANRGYRRVVPSPQPIRVVEINAIKKLIDAGVITVTVGGGGIPVINNNGTYTGIEAVIDKDFASEVSAEQLGFDVLMILTEVPQVAINFGKPDQYNLGKISVSELEKYKGEGHFAPGSMLPKVEAAIRFVKSGENKKAIITSLENAIPAMNGMDATIVSSGE